MIWGTRKVVCFIEKFIVRNRPIAHTQSHHFTIYINYFHEINHRKHFNRQQAITHRS